jgi:hypothetical protein
MRVFLFLLLIFVTVPFCFSQDHGTGLLIDDEEYLAAPIRKKQVQEIYNQLPPVSSIKKYCPRSGNQFSLETASSWATAYAAMSILRAKEKDISDPSAIAKMAFSPIFNYTISQANPDSDCEAPLSLFKSLYMLEHFGAPDFMDFIQFCPVEVPEDVKIKAKDNFNIAYAKLYNLKDDPEEKIKSIKKSLVEGYPVVAGFTFGSSFFSAKDFWMAKETTSTIKKFNHVVCIVGFNDHKYGGAFEVLNSWGKGWGNEGFIWIPYSAFKTSFNYAYEVYPKKSAADLSVKVECESSRGVNLGLKKNSDGHYQTSQSFGAGTNFQIKVKSQGFAYIYILGGDNSHEYFPIFPEATEVASFNYDNNRLIFPGENDYYQLDSNVGSDFIIVIASQDEQNVESLAKTLMTGKGTINDRLRLVGNVTQVEWSNESAFKVKNGLDANEKVVMLLEIKHH